MFKNLFLLRKFIIIIYKFKHEEHEITGRIEFLSIGFTWTLTTYVFICRFTFHFNRCYYEKTLIDFITLYNFTNRYGVYGTFYLIFKTNVYYIIKCNISEANKCFTGLLE